MPELPKLTGSKLPESSGKTTLWQKEWLAKLKNGDPVFYFDTEASIDKERCAKILGRNQRRRK